jgi:hypothetical protein
MTFQTRTKLVIPVDVMLQEDEMRPRKIRLRKPDTQPLPLLTQELTLPTGDRLVNWIVAAVPHPELAEPWLNDTAPRGEAWTNDTRPVPTEPVREDLEAEICYRRCDCLLAVDWCWCAR